MEIVLLITFLAIVAVLAGAWWIDGKLDQ